MSNGSAFSGMAGLLRDTSLAACERGIGFATVDVGHLEEAAQLLERAERLVEALRKVGATVGAVRFTPDDEETPAQIALTEVHCIVFNTLGESTDEAVAALAPDEESEEGHQDARGSEPGSKTMILTKRRAKFVYDAARLAAEAAGAPIVPVPWDEREDDFKAQFLDVIDRQCGPQRSTSPEELHGSWMQSYFSMGWTYSETYSREKRTHPDLVPYADLGQLERDKDAVFVALCEIARQWIYDTEEPPKKTDSVGGGCVDDDA